MDSSIYLTNDPVTFEPYEGDENGDLLTIENDGVLDPDLESLENDLLDPEESLPQIEIDLPDDLLTNDVYESGIQDLISVIDPDTIHDEVPFVDFGSFFGLSDDLPDHAVIFECNGVEVYFPTDYADNIVVSDGLLINLGSNYTAGAKISGYSVNNYLSSEITIPTYHSGTWYQYLQTYGQPYRVVDRYVNNQGNIASSTRSSVDIEWSGGNPWQGFTSEKILLFVIASLLAIMFIFRKGSR